MNVQTEKITKRWGTEKAMLTRIDTKATFSQKKDDNGRSVCSDRIYFLWFLLSFRCSICFYQAITEIEMKRKLVRRINKRKNVVSSTLVRKTFFLIDFFLCFGCVKNTRAISCCKGMLEHLRMGKKISTNMFEKNQNKEDLYFVWAIDSMHATNLLVIVRCD